MDQDDRRRLELLEAKMVRALSELEGLTRALRRENKTRSNRPLPSSVRGLSVKPPPQPFSFAEGDHQ